MERFYLLFFLIFLMGFQIVHSQSCEPDELYRDSTGGVYPRPYVQTDTSESGGIDKVVCIGEDYFFNFTVVVPDTLVFNGIPLVIRRIRLRGEEPITNLPKGIGYVCNPATCDMPAGTLGCISLHGVAEPDNEPGTKGLIINIDLVTNFVVIPTQFPNPAIAPGEYLITVAEPGDPECLTSIRYNPKPIDPIKIAPNPGDGLLMIYIPPDFSSRGRIEVFDASGKVVHWQNTDRLEGIWQIDLYDLPQGIYSVRLIGQHKIYTGKYVKNQ